MAKVVVTAARAQESSPGERLRLNVLRRFADGTPFILDGRYGAGWPGPGPQNRSGPVI